MKNKVAMYIAAFFAVIAIASTPIQASALSYATYTTSTYVSTPRGLTMTIWVTWKCDAITDRLISYSVRVAGGTSVGVIYDSYGLAGTRYCGKVYYYQQGWLVKGAIKDPFTAFVYS